VWHGTAMAQGSGNAVRAAVLQLRSGTDKAHNLARLTALVRRAAESGAELVVAPEAAMHDFGPPDLPLAPVAEPLDGPFVTGVAAVAAEAGVTVLAGMFETVPGDDQRAFNTVVAVGPTGVVGAYRKAHLFDALGWVESDRLVAGPAEPLVVEVGTVRVGVMTCYDLRFPELARALCDAGATAIAVPAAWVAGPLKEDQWLTLVRARAIESTAYVVAAGQPAPGYCGRSVVVDPLGVVVAGVADGERVATAELDPAHVADVRRRVPSLEHRRWAVVPKA
jgi:deaminated glutathione amidase